MDAISTLVIVSAGLLGAVVCVGFVVYGWRPWADRSGRAESLANTESGPETVWPSQWPDDRSAGPDPPWLQPGDEGRRRTGPRWASNLGLSAPSTGSEPRLRR